MQGDTDDATLVVDFLNTVDIDAATDVLASAAEFREWARGRGLHPGSPDLARDLRDALRALVQDGAGSLPAVPLVAGVAADGVPTLLGDDVASRVLAAVIRLADRGGWQRIKLCPRDVCLEAFYDRSKNRSRTWCHMSECGSVVKARAYRARRRDVT